MDSIWTDQRSVTGNLRDFQPLSSSFVNETEDEAVLTHELCCENSAGNIAHEVSASIECRDVKVSAEQATCAVQSNCKSEKCATK